MKHNLDNKAALALYQKISKACRGNAGIDWEIAECFGEIPAHKDSWRPDGNEWYRRPGDTVLLRINKIEPDIRDLWEPRPRTVSLEAAIAFVELYLPDWTIGSIHQDDQRNWRAELREGTFTNWKRAVLSQRGTTAALAVMEAAFAAIVPFTQRRPHAQNFDANMY